MADYDYSFAEAACDWGSVVVAEDLEQDYCTVDFAVDKMTEVLGDRMESLIDQLELQLQLQTKRIEEGLEVDESHCYDGGCTAEFQKERCPFEKRKLHQLVEMAAVVAR